MRYECTREFFEHMKKKQKTVVSVEVATSDTSDFDVSEIYLRFVRDDFASYLIESKHYRERDLYLEGGDEIVGRVLLPKYRLEIDETVRFSLGHFWVFKKLEVEGIRL